MKKLDFNVPVVSVGGSSFGGGSLPPLSLSKCVHSIARTYSAKEIQNILRKFGAELAKKEEEKEI